MRGTESCEPTRDASSEIRRLADVLLKEAGAYGKYPTPTADLVAAAGLRVERTLFTDDDVIRRMNSASSRLVKQAREALLGVVDIRGRTIYVRPDVPLGFELPPLVLHETAHAHLYWQRDIYEFVQEDGGSLERNVKDRFEREANQFAWELVFQLDGFRRDAESGEFSLRTPARLAHRYGTTPYAAIRRFVETNRRSCALIVKGLSTDANGPGSSPGRVVRSARFSRDFGDIDFRSGINPFVSSELFSDPDYGARTQLRLTGLNRCPVTCEAQTFSCDRHRFALVYPEHELLSVPQP